LRAIVSAHGACHPGTWAIAIEVLVAAAQGKRCPDLTFFGVA
jgi:hypothetical protein